jgi:two-component system alkaline phosphatase synthesis response regulator PhoP
MLTALSDENSHIKGLDSGADDYISKPISPKVLVSRINSLFRRVPKESSQKVLQFENLIIDPSSLW